MNDIDINTIVYNIKGCFSFSYGACPLNSPAGFCYTWAGTRGTYGVTRGRVSTIPYLWGIQPKGGGGGGGGGECRA